MSFSTGYINRNGATTNGTGGTGSNLQPLIQLFQVQDCGGANVGAPQYGMNAIIINKVIASICNTDSIVGTYNRPGRQVITNAAPFNAAANTVHSLAFKVKAGSGTIQFGATPATAIVAGDSETFTASRVIDVAVTITANAGSEIVITTIS